MSPEIKENILIYGGACLFILGLFGLGFIFYKLDWVLMIFLFVSPAITFLMRIALKDKIDKGNAETISNAVLYLLCVGIICMLMTYKNCRADLVSLFAAENNDWKFNAIEIFLFAIMLLFPYYSYKFSTDIRDSPAKKVSR